MFERFTDQARRVIVLAQEEAMLLNHDHIGTEHILLGLTHAGSGVAAQALQSLGIAQDAVRQQVQEVVGRGAPGSQSQDIPFTPQAKKALELAQREGVQFGHDYIGAEHILLGLLREGEGPAVQVLVRMGVDLNQVREQVAELLGVYPRNVRAAADPAAALAAKAGGRARKLLSQLTGR
jgi:ATP-dependent Clp protease ATP-binding subunit ClpC